MTRTEKRYTNGDIVKAKYNNTIYIGKVEYDDRYCEYRISIDDNLYINAWKKLELEVVGNTTDTLERLEQN